MQRWSVRIGLGLLALVALTLKCGATYEALALHIDRRGAGLPTVVFESGLSTAGAPLDWSLVHDAIARSTRACSYSRAGMLASDPARLLYVLASGKVDAPR